MGRMLAGWIVCVLLLAPFGAPAAQPGQAEEVMRLVNAFRAANGRPALTENAALMAAAQGHADWQAATHNHYHVGKDGSMPQDRANAAGYHGWVSEDAASGTTSAVSPDWAVDTGWANSPVHRAAMLSWAVDVGAGVAQDADETYYVLLVGSPSIQAEPTAVPYSTPGSIPDGATVHTVEEGETPGSIAMFYGVPLDALLTVNRLNPNEILQPGTQLIVPPATFSSASSAPAPNAPSAAAPASGQVPASDHAPEGIPPIVLIGVASAASTLALGVAVAARRRGKAKNRVRLT